MQTGVNLGAWYIPPYSKADNPAGVIMEIIKLASSADQDVLGAGNSSATKDDLKKINTVIGGIATPATADNDHTLVVPAKDTITDDMLTVQSGGSCAKLLFAFGTGQKMSD